MQETLRKSSFVFECQTSIQLNEYLNYRGFLSSYKHRIITWRFPWITWSQDQQFPIDAEFTHLWWIRYDNQTNVQQTLHITFAVWCTCILIFAYLTQHIPSDIQRYAFISSEDFWEMKNCLHSEIDFLLEEIRDRVSLTRISSVILLE